MTINTVAATKYYQRVKKLLGIWDGDDDDDDEDDDDDVNSLLKSCRSHLPCFQIYVGVVCNLIVFPINFLIVVLFRKSRLRKKRPSRIKEAMQRYVTSRPASPEFVVLSSTSPPVMAGSVAQALNETNRYVDASFHFSIFSTYMFFWKLANQAKHRLWKVSHFSNLYNDRAWYQYSRCYGCLV